MIVVAGGAAFLADDAPGAVSVRPEQDYVPGSFGSERVRFDQAFPSGLSGRGLDVIVV